MKIENDSQAAEFESSTGFYGEGFGTGDDSVACTTITAKSKDGSFASIAADVYLTKHGDIVVSWLQDQYKDNPEVKKLVSAAKEKFAELSNTTNFVNELAYDREEAIWLEFYTTFNDNNMRHAENAFLNNGLGNVTAKELHESNLEWVAEILRNTSLTTDSICEFMPNARPYVEEAEKAKQKSGEIDPEKDGTDHINIYSKGKTELGRMLTNFAKFPIQTKDGPFMSVEGYWYWMSIEPCPEREELRKCSGFKAKELGKEILKTHERAWDDNFETKILNATWYKFRRNAELLKPEYDGLPFKHYYNYGGHVVDVTEKYAWLIEGITQMRDRLVRERDAQMESAKEHDEAEK